MAQIRSHQDQDFPELETILRATKLFDKNFDRQARYKTKIELDPESIIVAERDNKIVGGVILIYDPFASSIWHLCVDPKYQGRGIGTGLMEKAFEILRSKGTDYVVGYIKADDHQLAEFYEKRGVRVCRNQPLLGIEKTI